MRSTTYRTGQQVPATGVYTVIHDEHRLISDVVLLECQAFPRCERCSEPVGFELLYIAPYLGTSRIAVHELPAMDEPAASGSVAS